MAVIFGKIFQCLEKLMVNQQVLQLYLKKCVFYYRLNNQLNELNNTKFTTKFGGAVGNLNAHFVSYPNIKWDVELENL